MKTLIVFASKHGTTEKVAKLIKDKLNQDTTIINLQKTKNIDINPYDQILIGGSIHAGLMQKRVRLFCTSNLSVLLKKRIGLFLSCMDEKKAEEQFNQAFPEPLRKHAISCKITGGEFLMEKMNFFEKAIVKKVSGITEPTNNIKEDQINDFVTELGLAEKVRK
jgi:menaquinone-dependent protoporphyrinogen oxidase